MSKMKYYESPFHAVYDKRTADLKCKECDVEIEKKIFDSNVEAIRAMLLQRSQVGIEKYGTTTDRDDLSLRDWLQHALEETLDKAVYLKAAISKIDRQN